MSNRAITWAYEQKCGSVGAKSVLVKLADQANDEGLCYPSMDYIARHCECSRRSVSRIIRKLEQLHLIDKHPRLRGGMKTSNEYSLRLPSVANNQNSTKLDGTPCHIDVTSATPTMGQALAHKPIREPKNKKSGADAPCISSTIPSHKRSIKLTRAGRTVPPELQPTISKVVARINELAGTAYKPDSKIVLDGLVSRLRAGAIEQDLMAVVENRWAEWGADSRMRQYFNPETLFRESKFEKYLNAARMNGTGRSAAVQPKDIGNGLVEVDGLKMTTKDYERKYGSRL